MEFEKYSFHGEEKVSLDDLNLPQELKDYVTNFYDTDQVSFVTYPKTLIDRNMILATWCGFDLNDDNIEFQTFNMYEQLQFDVFSQGVTFYGKVDETIPGYMVYYYTAEESVIIVKV